MKSSREAAPVVTVPKAAVVTKDGSAVVFVLDGKTVHLVRVSIGGDGPDGVTVDRGLTGTESLVLRPPGTLKDGDTVKPRTEGSHA